MPRYVVYRPAKNIEEAKKELLRVDKEAKGIEITPYPKKKTRIPGYRYYKISFVIPKVKK